MFPGAYVSVWLTVGLFVVFYVQRIEFMGKCALQLLLLFIKQDDVWRDHIMVDHMIFAVVKCVK